MSVEPGSRDTIINGAPITDGNRPFVRVKSEWEKHSSDPHLITELWREHFRERGVDVAIPELDWTEVEVLEPVATLRGKVSGFMVPNFLGKGPGIFARSSQEVLSQLAEMYPVMTNLRTSYIRFDRDIPGWVKIASMSDAPDKGTDQEDILEFLEAHPELQGERLSTYVLGTQMRAALGLYHFDFGTTTSSRLPGTRGTNGELYGARIYENGNIHIVSVDPKFKSGSMGARFEQTRPI